MLKRILTTAGMAICVMGVLSLGACGTPEETEAAPGAASPEDIQPLAMLQLIPPREGDTIAILHTNFGDITMRFFPEETPLAYENFVTHARNGFYDGVIFHRVLEDFMIQGGDPTGTGMGGESIWGEGFGQEMSLGLRHFRGAVAMAQTRLPNSINSQFYIVQSTHAGGLHPEIGDIREFLIELMDIPQDHRIGYRPDGTPLLLKELFPTAALEKYLEYGGTPWLDLPFFNPQGGHTVFAHIIDGMDVVDAIAAVPVNRDGLPDDDVIIQSVTVTVYRP